MSHNLVEALVPLFVFAGISTLVYIIINGITSYVIKKKLIDKGYVNEESQSLFTKNLTESNRLSSLKWGLVITFAGMAMILMEVIPYSHDSPLPFGLLAIFVGGGFLVYYFIAKDKVK